MKFYNRKEELRSMREVYRQCDSGGKMTVLTGRRRVGKTLLATEFARRRRHLYLFVSRKAEPLLCEEFTRQIRATFDVSVIGEIPSFKEIFRLLLELSKTRKFTLIVDEFQEFYTINPSVFSDVQHLWDRYKRKSRMNLIFVGSVHSLMSRVFQNSKYPLFNRMDQRIVVQPFSVKEIATVLLDHSHGSIRTLIDFYILTGGMPPYIDYMVSNKAFTRRAMLKTILNPSSPLLEEGRNVLIEEFGKEYGMYFSILSLIASGKTSRPAIESILERNVGGHLDRLESDFQIVSKHRPINAKPDSRTMKYMIRDNFLNFWFRFIYRNRSVVEMGNFGYVLDIVERDYSTYSSFVLEKMFQDLLAQTGQYNQVGAYWGRQGQNEIDIVAVNDKDKNILFAEINLNPRQAGVRRLAEKANIVLPSYPGYKASFHIWGPNDIRKFIRLDLSN